MSKSTIVRPLIVMKKDRDKAGIVASVLGLAMCAAFYPLLFNTRRFLFYYSTFIIIIAFLSFCVRYWINRHKNNVVFRMDENGVCFYDEESHSFEWSELKQVSVRFTTKENGKKTRLLFLTTQDNIDYRFNIFYFVMSYVWTIQRLKKAVPYFSKGSVPFKYYKIWDKSYSL